MTIEIALLISIVSVAFSLISGIFSMKRSSKTDTKQDASEMTTVIIRLEHINNGVTEIKTEMRSTKDEIKAIGDRTLVTEQSLKSAWKQIDEIKERIGTA